MRTVRILSILTILFSLISCATIGDKLLNPYASDFQCPLADKGECIKLKDAYEKSIKDTASYKEINVFQEGGKSETSSDKTNQKNISEIRYQQEVFKKIASLLAEPETPVAVFPKTVRVLFLPYVESENSLMLPRYAYFFLDEPRWVLENYLKNIE